MDAKECREAFEAWAKEQKQGFMLSHVIDGVYLDDPTHCAWLAWQAAWNRRAGAQEAAVVEAARNLVAQRGRHNTEVAYQRLVAAIAGEKKE